MERFVRSRGAMPALVVAVAVGAFASGGGRAQDAAPSSPPLPIDTSLRLVEANGSSTVYANCTVCHTVAPILAHRGLTPDQWAGQVEKMRNDYGAEFDDATAKQIVAYLAAHYAVPPPSVEDELLGPARRLLEQAAATTTPSVPAGDTSLAVAIVDGSCEATGAPAWDLGLTAPWGGADPVAPTPNGPVLLATGATQSTLDPFVLSGFPRAVEVRAESAADAPVVACGDIVDNVVDDQLVVVVAPRDDSGIGGFATLTQHPEGFAGLGGNVVEAEVLLVRGFGVASGGVAAAPVASASPMATAAALAALPAVGECADGTKGDCLPVGMHDISFAPNTLSAPAGAKVGVTVVNQGSIVHNFSIDAHGNDGLSNLGVSVTLQPGGLQAVPVDAPPGDYYFYCDIPGHEAAGMRGYLTIAADGALSATTAAGTPPER